MKTNNEMAEQAGEGQTSALWPGNPEDNAAIARVALADGAVLDGGGVTVRQTVPAGFKVALRRIAAGEAVARRGESVGRASTAIEAGELVHCHNLEVDSGPAVAAATATIATPEHHADDPMPTFRGYLREDGRAGTRNYIAVVCASNCAAQVTEAVAHSYRGEAMPPNIDGVVALTFGGGCGHPAPNLSLLRKTMAGVLNHPNVAGALILGLGCETNQIDYFLGGGAGRLYGRTLQGEGGSRATVEASRRDIATLMERAGAVERVDIPVSKLMVGFQSAAPDPFSEFTTGRAFGSLADRLVGFGGTVVLAGTPDTFGAEAAFAGRARCAGVGDTYLEFTRHYRTYLERRGAAPGEALSADSRAHGVSTLREQALGVLAMGGHAPFGTAISYADPVPPHGLVFMDSPANNLVSITGVAAGGATVVLLATGLGSSISFPTVPVAQISGNPVTASNFRGDLDLDVSAGEDEPAEQAGARMLDLLIAVASGAKTRTESLHPGDFVPWELGPML